MLTITERLERALFEADELEFEIIDLRDQAAAKRALDNTRGPSIGWNDYEAGKDYQPPYVWNTSNTAGVHRGKAGPVTIYSPGKPIGPEDTQGNPFSKKYGGVRPWSHEEVLKVLSAQTGDPDSEGKLWQIANKPTVRRAYEMTQKAYDQEDAVALGMNAAWRALMKDGGRPGIRFTSFAGFEIENGMRNGVPAGYGDEYRMARGLIGRLELVAKRARANIAAGRPADLQITNPNRRDPPRTLRDLTEYGIRDLLDPLTQNPDPGPTNPYGLLPPRLIAAGSGLLTAIEANDVDEITKALELLDKTRQETEEEEDTYRIRGPSTDTTITKSKENPTIAMKPLTMTSPKTGREMERGDTLSPGSSPLIRQTELGEYEEEERNIILSDFEIDSDQYDGLDREMQGDIINKILSKYNQSITTFKSLKAKAMDELNMPEAEFDLVREYIKGGRTHSSGSEYGQGKVGTTARDQHTREALAHMLHILRAGRGEGVGWSADLARKALDKFREVVQLSGEERAAARRYEIVPTPQGVHVVDAETTQVMGKHDYRAEAERQIEELQSDPLTATIESIVQNLTSQYGEYREELLTLGKQILGLLRGYGNAAEIMQEIDDLDQVAQQDQERGERNVTIPEITQQQYRVLLRIYGIDNYPERGTRDDPEFDPETGQLSDWAKLGYPTVVSNKEIANDLGGISSARITQLKSGVRKIMAMVTEKLQSSLYESGEIDDIDYGILTELRVHFGRVLFAEIHSRQLV